MRRSNLGAIFLAALVGMAGWAVAEETDTESLSKTESQSEDDPQAEPKPLDNRLKWSTASEVDNFGYDIYRGDSEEGPFARLTKDPLPGNGTTDETSYYEFSDAEIDPSRDYYYYIESIALDGTRERFTPIIRAKAKRPNETAEGEEPAEATEAVDGQSSDSGSADRPDDPSRP